MPLSQLRPPDSRALRALEALAIACFSLLWLGLAWRAAAAVAWSAALPWLLAVACLAGVLAADLASGVVHFSCDRFFCERTPLIGALFIAPFREHHRDPLAIARHGFCELNGNNAIALLPWLGLAHVGFDPAAASLDSAFGRACLLALTAAVAATNQVHSWAHRSDPPRLVHRLQRAGVILSSAAHDLHHRGEHARAYCITTGWLNRVLDRHAVFARLEAALRGCGAPRRGRSR
jgi:ubiquitin-conjugating enzyme E2 variant